MIGRGAGAVDTVAACAGREGLAVAAGKAGTQGDDRQARRGAQAVAGACMDVEDDCRGV